MDLARLNVTFSEIPEKFSNDLIDHWVAIKDGKIVFESESFLDLFEKVKKAGLEKKVLFHKVPKDEIIIV